MFRPTTLAALALAARGGEDHLARRALSQVDPVVALVCRPRVAKAIAAASSLVADRNDRPHVLRLAYLREAGALADLDFEDRASVTRAFDALVPVVPPGPRAPRVTLLGFVGAAVVAAAVFALHQARKPWDPRGTKLGHALADDLPSYVASVANASRAERRGSDHGAAMPIDESGRDGVLRAFAHDLGPRGEDAAGRLLAGYAASCLSPAHDLSMSDAMFAGLQGTNAALRDAHLPYWLDVLGDAETGPLVVSYYVTASQTALAGGAGIPLLHLQRLDTLNRTFAALGYTSPRAGAAVVTLDTIENEAASLLLPALAGSEPVHLADDETEKEAPAWLAPLEARAGVVLRGEMPEGARPALVEVATLLGRRAEVLAGLRSDLAWSDQFIAGPKHLVERARFEELEGRIARTQLEAWRDINDALAEPRLRAAADVYMTGLTTLVDRHEVQHQIDFRAGIVPVPDEVRATLGAHADTSDTSLAPTPLEDRCKDELSAELAAIAATPSLAGTGLTLTTFALFNEQERGTPYTYVAAALLTAVARELGEPIDECAPRCTLRRERAAALYLAIASRSAPEIATAAGRAYARLFGRDVPVVTWGIWIRSERWAPR